ncbi:MAG: hypothetical protein H7834_12265 [Magnetococcus sp. YQC-9]
MNIAPPPLEILLTVDVEFSIHGAFTFPDQARPLGEPFVVCRDGAGREQGLGLMLDTFAEHGLLANFFCETLQTTWFGAEPMGTIARRIHAAGHDVQLHLHPCWKFFDHSNWREQLRCQRPNDNCHGRTPEEIVDWIQTGRTLFEQWGLPPPVALRAGGLRVDRELYRVMAQLEMPLASHIGLGVFLPAEPELHLACGLHRFDGVLELPVFSYHARLPRPAHPWRSLTLTGTSWWEMRALLEQARLAHLSPVVILLHPHDLAGPAPTHPAHRIHQSRLRNLCRLISTHPDRYRAVSIHSNLIRWQKMATIPSKSFSPPFTLQLARLLENLLNR